MGATVELPGDILGTRGDMACNNRGESHLDRTANGRSNYLANLPANFSLARFINVRSNSFTRSCLRGRAWSYFGLADIEPVERNRVVTRTCVDNTADCDRGVWEGSLSGNLYSQAFFRFFALLVLIDARGL